ncbi:MAG: type IV secretory system conjugative DNA transfer family protein [Jatrophihabitans sp.]
MKPPPKLRRLSQRQALTARPTLPKPKRRRMTSRYIWQQLHWPRPLEAAGPVSAVRAWAADQRSPEIVLEARAQGGQIHYLLGCAPTAMFSIHQRLTTAVPQARLTKFGQPRAAVAVAGMVKLSTRHRALRSDTFDVAVRQILGALSTVNSDELLVLQLILGPRRIPLAVPNQSPSTVAMPWYQAAWIGNGGTVDGEKRAALRDKVSDHGFAATIRIGVSAATKVRRRSLLLGLFAALRVTEAPGLKARLGHEPATHLNLAAIPWRWPLRLNVAEAVAWTGWPIGDDELPGQPPLHPKQVAPMALAVKGDRVVGEALAPGVTGQLGYSVTDSLRHTWVLGPTGTGKSTLLLNLIHQDLLANRPVVVIEPNDLITDLLARIPESRRDDVVLLDCLDPAPVGINPLARHGRSPELVADSLLGMFQSLYGEGIGPRSTDILANCLNVLARRDDASLVMLPLLLTNNGFRRSVTQQVSRDDPIAAGPFWAWFNQLSDDARSQVIAPLQNKLRPLLRPTLRNVLAQRSPRFNIRQVLTENKVLLVPLQKGVIGPDTAELLGALVIAELWLAIRERRAISENQRTPVRVYIDEAQDYLRLPTDLSDALATSRSLKVGWHLAHQYRDQLSPSMRAAFEANARSRICFQLGSGDARAMAAGQSVIAPEDFTALPAYQIYASLLQRGSVQPWASATTQPAPEKCSQPSDIRARSRRQYGQPLADITADFAALIDTPTTDPTTNAAPGRRRRSTP